MLLVLALLVAIALLVRANQRRQSSSVGDIALDHHEAAASVGDIDNSVDSFDSSS